MTAPDTKAVALTPTEEKFKLERGEPSFAEMMQLASTLLKTGFLPKSITTPGQALAIILTGREMGLGPMQSLRSIGVINGRPVIAADLQLAIFHRAGGASKWLTLTETEAKLWLKHPNGVEHTETFTMQDAERAGLTQRGDTYAKYPKAMLRSRAITAGLKSAGFEATAGTYDPDELAPLVVAPGPPTMEELSQKPRQLAQDEPREVFDAETGEVTPKRASTARWPLGKLPPDGKKGVLLADMSTEDLVAGKAWAVKKDPKDFAKLIEQVDEELEARRG